MRIDYSAESPKGIAPIYALNRYIETTSLEAKLVHLIELRASQINGCAFCMHLHTLQLEEVGETKERIACLSAWEETELFSPRERAALAWTEAVTLVSETHVPDETYQEVRGHFSEKELSDLTLAIAGINVWNRLAIAFRQDPSIAPAVLEQLHAARRASTHV